MNNRKSFAAILAVLFALALVPFGVSGYILGLLTHWGFTPLYSR